MVTAEEEVYTPHEVGRILKVSVYTIREMLKTGGLKGFKVGTKWRIPMSSIRELTEASSENR